MNDSNGSVFKRKLPSGSTVWCYAIDAGRDEDGKRKRIYKSGFATRKAAGDALHRIVNEKNESGLVAPDPQTVSGFLAEWFKEHAERNCTGTTVERYRALAAYVLPAIGTTKLQELSSLMLERVLNRVHDSGGWDRKTKTARPLGARSVRHIGGLLHVAFDTAVRWKLIKANPMDGVVLPKVIKHEAKVLEAGPLLVFLNAVRARAAYLYAFVMLAMATGCRRGELLALTWPDVDFNERSLKISKSLEQTKAGLRIKSPKNEKTRVISLPGIAIDVLRTHRGEQSENRRLCGPDYRDDLNLVFAAPDGNYLKPDTITSKICVLASKAGLQGNSLHTLRHTHGSQLLSDGVSLPAVSKRLGHSSIRTTADIYAHALSKDELAAAATWDDFAKKAKIK